MLRITKISNTKSLLRLLSNVAESKVESPRNFSKVGSTSLADSDPEVYSILKAEKLRQREGLELIASENFTSRDVRESVGSCATNKYAEGYPGERYYAGCQHVDQIENICRKRALEAFRLDNQKWGVNVQPYSGSPANLAVFTGLLKPHDRIMGLNLPSGGHLTHGYMTDKKRISATSIFFESMPYDVDEKGIVDYDQLHANAKLFRPKIIIAGYSAYCRLLDYRRFREICDDVGAVLHSDMAHITGLVAANLLNDPFEYSDIVTCTTHKTLRGPRGGLIFYRVGEKGTDKKGNKIMYDFKDKIDFALFPSLQGGPHMHTISGIAVALKNAQTPEFREYQIQVIKNARALAQELQLLGYTIVSGGTDNHIVLLDLRPKGIDGMKVDTLLEMVGMPVNGYELPGDLDPEVAPGGVRFGSSALTSRNLGTSDFQHIAQLVHRGIEIATQSTMLPGFDSNKDYAQYLQSNDYLMGKISSLKKDVHEYANKFPFPGDYSEI